MQVVKRIPQITKEDILNKVNSYTIYCYYLGKNVKLDTVFCSPFYTQKTPSFYIYCKSNTLYYADFADSDRHGDCVMFVQQLYNLTFSEAIQKIAKDFGLITGDKQVYKTITEQYQTPVIEAKEYSKIQVQAKVWDEKSLQWWDEYGITEEELSKEQVYNVDQWVLNHEKQYIGPDELCFAYRYYQGFKIYYPLREGKGKWASNIPLSTAMHIGNLSKDHDGLVVKSLKDYLVAVKLYPYTCYIQNESIGSCTPDIADRITSCCNGRVFYYGDSDSPGKKSSYKITESYNWKHVNTPDRLLPEVNDIAGWRKKEGSEPIVNHIKLKGIK